MDSSIRTVRNESRDGKSLQRIGRSRVVTPAYASLTLSSPSCRRGRVQSAPPVLSRHSTPHSTLSTPFLTSRRGPALTTTELVLGKKKDIQGEIDRKIEGELKASRTKRFGSPQLQAKADDKLFPPFVLLAIERKTLAKNLVQFDDRSENVDEPIFITDLIEYNLPWFRHMGLISREYYTGRKIKVSKFIRLLQKRGITGITLWTHGFATAPQEVFQYWHKLQAPFSREPFKRNHLIIPVIWPCQNQYPGSLVFNYPGDRVRAKKAGESLVEIFRKAMSKINISVSRGPQSTAEASDEHHVDELMDRMDSFTFDRTMERVETISRESLRASRSVSSQSRGSGRLSVADRAADFDMSMQRCASSVTAANLNDFKFPDEKESHDYEKEVIQKMESLDLSEAGPAAVEDSKTDERMKENEDSKPDVTRDNNSRRRSKFLKKAARLKIARCKIKVTIWTHSMGTWMLYNFFSNLPKKELEQKRFKFPKIFMTAPNISPSLFDKKSKEYEEVGQKMLSMSNGIYVIYCEKDFPLRYYPHGGQDLGLHGPTNYDEFKSKVFPVNFLKIERSPEWQAYHSYYLNNELLRFISLQIYAPERTEIQWPLSPIHRKQSSAYLLKSKDELKKLGFVKKGIDHLARMPSDVGLPRRAGSAFLLDDKKKLEQRPFVKNVPSITKNILAENAFTGDGVSTDDDLEATLKATRAKGGCILQ